MKRVGVGVSGVAVIVGPSGKEYQIASEVFITNIGSIVIPYVQLGSFVFTLDFDSIGSKKSG